MPVFGTGPRRTDGRTNPQINATIRYLSSPNMISNLSFWFDANDNTTIQLQQGNTSNVTGWTSKGNLPIQISTIAQVAPLVPNNAVLPYTVPNALNGRQTIFMNGVSSMLQFTSSMSNTAVATNNETTIFTVANPTNAANNASVFAYDLSFFDRIVAQINFATAGTSFFYGNGSPIVLTGAGTYFGLGYYQNTFYRRNSDTSIAIKFRGAPLTSATNSATMNTNSHFGIGGYPGYGNPTTFNTVFPYYNTIPRFFIGNYAEILWYNRGLTDDEIVGVEGYLAKKWGIQNQLKFNHIGVATGPPLMGYRLPLLGRISTLAVSNAALWLDTYDTNFLSSNFAATFTPGSANPVNNAFVGGIIDKASQCNATSSALRQPKHNLFGLNDYPTLTYIQSNINNRLTGNAPRYLGSSMSMFCVFNVASNSGTGYVVSVSDQEGAPTNLGMGIYYNSNNRTIGINRANTVFSTSYTLQSNILVSAFVNGTPSTIGGLVPSTMTMNINGAQVNMSSLGSLLSSFSTPYYSMGGVFNFGNTNTSISEFIVYYRTLSSVETVAIESQLIRKWGLQSNAPISYINAGPNISTPYLWVDAYSASYISTTLTSDGLTRVDTAFDRSGNGRNFKIDTTYSNVFYNRTSTMNSMNSLYFSTGTYNGLLINSNPLYTFSTNSFSWFMVYNQISTPTGSARVFYANRGLANNENDTFSYQLTNIAGIPTQATPYYVRGTYQGAGANINRGSNYLTSIVVNNGPTIDTVLPSTYNVYQNFGSGPVLTSNIEYAAPSTVNINYFGIGSASNAIATGFNGLVSEVILYNRALSNAERQTIETYLLNKWNISTIISNVPVVRGLNLWLDAYDPDTIIFSTNTNLVRQWRDKSISTLHFSNALVGGTVKPPTYTINPANNLAGLLFSNSAPTTTFATGLYNCNFNYPRTTEATIFTVAQWNSGNASFYSPVFCMLSNNEFVNNNANNFIVVGPGNGNSVNLYRSTAGDFLANIPNTLNKPTLLTGVFNSSFSTTLIVDIPQNNIALGRNGIIGSRNISSFISTLGNGLAVSSVNFNVNQAVLGLRQPAGGDQTWYHSGYIHEVLLYNRTLSFNERQQIESYLLCKWNI